MKVAQVHNPFEHVAGIERFVLETSREMSARGIETRIYTASVDPGTFARTRDEVEIRKIVLPSTSIFRLYSNLSVSKHLIEIASSWADVIILHSGLGMAEYSWRRRHVPCFPFFHIDKFDPRLFGPLRILAPLYSYPLRLQESKCIRSIPFAFVNSNSLSHRVREYLKGGQFVVIPLGVDVDRFRPTWADDGYLLMAGRYHPANNFELGLKVAAQVPCKIVIAGVQEKKFLWYYRRLRQLVESSQTLSQRVELLTPQSDEHLIHLIQNCSVFLSPRIYDYLGLAALEAMACGKPVVAYEAAEEESTHIPVVRCGDRVSQWQDAVGTLVNDKGLRFKLGQESRQFVEHHHTWKRTVDLMMDSVKLATQNSSEISGNPGMF